MTVSHKSVVAAALMIFVIGGEGFATLPTAIAGETIKLETVKTETNPADLANLKTSNDAFEAMREINAARLAIFQGDPVNAARLVVEASRALDKVKTDISASVENSKTAEMTAKEDKTAKEPAIKSKGTKTDSHQIVFDARMAIVDDFVVTPEKQAVIAKANEHLKKGEHKEGIEKLKLADIELSVSQYVMPFEQTVKRVNTANGLMAEHKYYEANLALKAAVDGVYIVTDTVIEPATEKTTKEKDKTKNE